ncbi:cob(I)yrinic acid a,c-diamide adenosyltransferase [Numidum massiliense]|uniref:cob(I)yrinic acid a,c-diamide adenosyltransferase n=1 Tax=Numidum massiliense TaxID=1522315 RepID=UPI0006D58359|nr:cob(I)yrinic acid a,c-diamide adenosyltransferase [Numidum massiliense]
MRLYTKTGDKGQTSVVGGRVAKDDVRVTAYGTIDEANCFVGQAITQLTGEQYADLIPELQRVQHELFDCGSDLARIDSGRPYKVNEAMVTFLETRIDAYIAEAPELKRFILPGGTAAAATLHIARTVTRRAERYVVTLQREASLNEVVLKYLNRLSDYLFAVARVVNARANVKDVEYARSGIVFRGGKRQARGGKRQAKKRDE